MKNTNNRGFTLIELLVVIAIISLLSSIILASLSSAQSKGQNAAVISEVHEIQIELELYYDSNNGYPNPNPSGSGYYCIGASSCTTINSLGSTVNVTDQLAINTPSPQASQGVLSQVKSFLSPNVAFASVYTTGVLAQFAKLTTPIIYYCSLNVNPCKFGSAWLMYPQASGNTTTYYAQQVGASSITTTY